jgi:GNAT superfamily N-acetyltransferase
MAFAEVTRTYLELDPARPTLTPSLPAHASLLCVTECPPSFYRYLYIEVGRAHRWTDRLNWTDKVIRQHLASERRALWVLYISGAPAGFFELQLEEDGSVQVAYFGLLPEFLGRGVGRALLECAIVEARNLSPDRVWLHTCTLDHHAALPNYLARGFRPLREEKYMVDVT